MMGNYFKSRVVLTRDGHVLVRYSGILEVGFRPRLFAGRIKIGWIYDAEFNKFYAGKYELFVYRPTNFYGFHEGAPDRLVAMRSDEFDPEMIGVIKHVRSFSVPEYHFG